MNQVTGTSKNNNNNNNLYAKTNSMDYVVQFTKKSFLLVKWIRSFNKLSNWHNNNKTRYTQKQRVPPIVQFTKKRLL